MQPERNSLLLLNGLQQALQATPFNSQAMFTVRAVVTSLASQLPAYSRDHCGQAVQGRAGCRVRTLDVVPIKAAGTRRLHCLGD